MNRRAFAAAASPPAATAAATAAAGCQLRPDPPRAVRQLATFRESANPGDAAVQPGIHAGLSL